MLSVLFLFFLGLVFLVKGSDIFVNSAASIAKKLGVSELIIGLTLVSVGTSVPEYASAIISSFQGRGDLVMGNIVGANINNIALIIGVTAIFTRIKITPEIILRDGYIMLFTGALFYVSILNGRLSFVEGFMFLLLYLGYLVFLFEANQRADGRRYNFREFIPYFFKFQYIITLHRNIGHNGLIELAKKRPRLTLEELKLNRLFEEALLKDFLLLSISGFGIFIGANYFVGGAVYFAHLLGLPLVFMGMLLAFGTTMPELSVSFTAARKGYGDISVGNILGSCVTNILLIVGTSVIISPINVTELTINYSAPFMLAIMAASVFFMTTKNELDRREAGILLIIYLLYLVIFSVKSMTA